MGRRVPELRLKTGQKACALGPSASLAGCVLMAWCLTSRTSAPMSKQQGSYGEGGALCPEAPGMGLAQWAWPANPLPTHCLPSFMSFPPAFLHSFPPCSPVQLSLAAFIFSLHPLPGNFSSEALQSWRAPSGGPLVHRTPSRELTPRLPPAGLGGG